MKTAAASVINASASEPPMWNRMRKTREFLRKLSLKAEKNWVQNRGAKRRVRSKDEDMAVPVVGSGGAARMITATSSGCLQARRGEKTTIWAKGQSAAPPIGRRPETHANVWFGADRGSKSSQGCPGLR